MKQTGRGSALHSVPPQQQINSALTDRQMASVHVCPSTSKCVLVRVQALDRFHQELSKGLQIFELVLSFSEEEGTILGGLGVEKTGRESLMPQAMFTLFRERSSILVGTAFRDTQMHFISSRNKDF